MYYHFVVKYYHVAVVGAIRLATSPPAPAERRAH
jgi:hypothetical protein